MSKINFKKTLIVDVDIQNAFGAKAASDKLRGLRPTEQSEVDNAAKLTEAVHEGGGTVAVTADWHNKPGTKVAGQVDNRAVDEFGIYGEHAVAGTEDAKLNDPLEQVVQKLEAKSGQRTILGVDKFDTTARDGASRLVEVHKNTYDVTKRVAMDGSTKPNQGFIALLAKARSEGIDTILVTGKIAEVCVKAAAESIKELFPDLNVVVVADAVSALPVGVAETIGLQSKEQVLEGFRAKGISVAQTADLLPKSSFIADGICGN